MHLLDYSTVSQPGNLHCCNTCKQFYLCHLITHVGSWSHHYHQDSDLFHHHKYLPLALYNHISLCPFPIIPNAWQPSILYFKNVSIIYNRWPLEIGFSLSAQGPAVSINSLLLFTIWVVVHGTDAPFTLKDTFLSNFSLLQVKLPWTPVNRFCVNTSFNFPGINVQESNS